MRVLIAGDDAVSRQALETILPDLGHTFEIARDGAAAWEIHQRFRPSVLITDWIADGTDGPELYRRIRASTDTGYTYVILLAAPGDHARVLAGMHAGADDYLTTPVVGDEVAARLLAAERIGSLHDRLSAREADLDDLRERLRDESRRDALTRLGNRLGLLEDLERLEARAWRYGHGYTVALCDIDRFSAYNDEHGHLAGDDVLRRVAGALAAQFRSGDCGYRFGGEEILIVFPEQSEESALIAMERLRRAVEALAIPHPGNDPSGIVTISAGVALDRGDRADDVLRRADAALHRAKHEGRNRVVFEDSEAAEAR
jgi:diguanylate cyclase (GGDEF)-like protein